jgi:hypothetical protein
MPIGEGPEIVCIWRPRRITGRCVDTVTCAACMETRFDRFGARIMRTFSHMASNLEESRSGSFDQHLNPAYCEFSFHRCTGIGRPFCPLAVSAASSAPLASIPALRAARDTHPTMPSKLETYYVAVLPLIRGSLISRLLFSLLLCGLLSHARPIASVQTLREVCRCSRPS